ncbi:hypothetical protein UFOVP1157_41 [uncultured Caudovirales phage]|uniref:Uncharacterized protein n=1 Tax=uncultured Caudovirales phage TaxID=2100421 RepID=A0A6J5RSE7_9CAUD|nr:hypothetical protein UFOVP497_54 [uncultured Caudovirales phage]CAB4164437.1 hypothetical protein UFOVP834_30 [uncultured Caudovirales phage]CAB4172384.1 hypothetical protein UFOVP922_41 [uncultured Caudovirales phage]CAB4177691.1 hypothetical protein UFOVP1006_34 [uncultured Caudovirales phage]CAB4184164.1 hypothetical protein UFOVP1096_46 [uncultured Caudovirales phage]
MNIERISFVIMLICVAVFAMSLFNFWMVII